MNFSNQIKQYIFIIILILFIELVKFSLTFKGFSLLRRGGNNHPQRSVQVPFRFRWNNRGSGGLHSYAGQRYGRWRLRSSGSRRNSQRRNSGRQSRG